MSPGDQMRNSFRLSAEKKKRNINRNRFILTFFTREISFHIDLTSVTFVEKISELTFRGFTFHRTIRHFKIPINDVHVSQ